MAALTITNLTKTYANGVTALKGINLTVQEGDFFALLGPNGAGKSTTIGILTSLVNKTSGDIKVYGYDLATQIQLAKTQIGLVPQEFNFNIFVKVHDILMTQAGYYGVKPALARERTEFYLKKLDLWEKRNDIARNLSGGMKRRLMIARALVHQPQLLILDEPTAGVDIEIRRSMWEFLREINKQGTTIVLTTHYLEEAENLCNNIAIIDHGEIIENTSMRQLLKKLNRETFVFYLEKSLNFKPELTNFPCYLIDENTLEVEVHKDQSLNQLFTELNENHIEALSMRNKTNRLEELFLKLINNQNHDVEDIHHV
ncbi:MAG: ABC transporter ATP-binding protein [Gammaproteobacteria bacterium]